MIVYVFIDIIDQNTCEGCVQEKDLFILSAKFGGEFVVDTTKDSFLDAISNAKIIQAVTCLLLGILMTQGI